MLLMSFRIKNKWKLFYDYLSYICLTWSYHLGPLGTGIYITLFFFFHSNQIEITNLPNRKWRKPGCNQNWWEP